MTLLILFSPSLHAYEPEPEVKLSTNPIGSPFFRHLAFDRNLDLREVVKFEKKGFGRAETVTLILISSATGKPLKEYGKRRLKEKVTLRQFAEEAKLDYDALYRQARAIKEGIEAKGDKNLPPPVFDEKPKDEKAAGEAAKKEKKGTSVEPSPSPTTGQSPTAGSTSTPVPK
ncbi:MAG: hypothetical protein LHV69_01785 [Elusimicrobia bacterium]|nr:hypothetical protein [Candidatus Obscuribacterium magneticum]